MDRGTIENRCAAGSTSCVWQGTMKLLRTTPFEANSNDRDIVGWNGAVRKAVEVSIESLAYGLDIWPVRSMLLHDGQPRQRTVNAVEKLRRVLGLGNAIRDYDQRITGVQLNPIYGVRIILQHA